MNERLFDMPNLDDMSVDPADYEQAANVFQELERYCRFKAHAMRFRQDGKVKEALRHEHWCNQIYKVLPEWARW